MTIPKKSDNQYDEEAHQYFREALRHQKKFEKTELQECVRLLNKAIETNRANGGVYHQAMNELAYTHVLEYTSGNTDDFRNSRQMADSLSRDAYLHDVNQEGGLDYTAYWSRGFYVQSITSGKIEAVKLFMEGERVYHKGLDAHPQERFSDFQIEYLEAIADLLLSIQKNDDPNFAAERRQKAQNLLDKEIDMPSNIPDYYYWTIAYAYYAFGEYDNEPTHFEKALNIIDKIWMHPRNRGFVPEILKTRADILSKMPARNSNSLIEEFISKNSFPDPIHPKVADFLTSLENMPRDERNESAEVMIIYNLLRGSNEAKKYIDCELSEFSESDFTENGTMKGEGPWYENFSSIVDCTEKLQKKIGVGL